MHELEMVLMLLMAAVALVASARRSDIPYPILLVLGGLVIGFVPGLHPPTLSPDIVFLIFLPPLLYAEAQATSWRDFQSNLRPISLLAIGLVLTTTVGVALVAHWFLPGFPLSVSFVLGAIVAPTDAVAVSAVGKRLGLPRNVLVILSGESLLNDATALVLYRAAIAAVLSGVFSAGAALLNFVWVSVGGIALGLLLGLGLLQILRRIEEATLSVTISLLLPFITYLPAERLGVSGVLATVAAGLLIGRSTPEVLSPQSRMQGRAFWSMLIFVMNNLLFILVGQQLREILGTLQGKPLPALLGDALLISATVILLRALWVILTAYLPRVIKRKLIQDDSKVPWRSYLVVAWTGARGGVSLAAALAIPLVLASGDPFPQRNMILFLTYGVIFSTLVLQGIVLPTLIRKLGLRSDGLPEQEEREARLSATRAVLGRLKELESASDIPRPFLTQMRARYESRLEQLTTPPDSEKRDRIVQGQSHFTRLAREVLNTEHNTIISLRDNGIISDDALRRIQREIDLEELRLETLEQEWQKSATEPAPEETLIAE